MDKIDSAEWKRLKILHRKLYLKVKKKLKIERNVIVGFYKRLKFEFVTKIVLIEIFKRTSFRIVDR